MKIAMCEEGFHTALCVCALSDTEMLMSREQRGNEEKNGY